ncbi:PREDICTED: putative tRNA pseudouridine synthase Pus10 [Amphimedon queenslandica]|uniref:tRNA pseudouridine(55) synthase n=1 Tax=Amphimedon queenslandica TaxID=400682 RepID=A0A1X7TUV9_AMPQE|nr:PREDICTED: putative tRNA pseudouridine synthase Pus10 [Amphimedon queenslandica]|eukprot:XP_003389791.1 PREDICTED: putative tRNA pseudouridine synthase Pus10 [Amphimedon queenslandica]
MADQLKRILCSTCASTLLRKEATESDRQSSPSFLTRPVEDKDKEQPSKRPKYSSPPDSPPPPPPVCQYCTGLLYDSVQSDIVSKVVDELKGEDYVGLTSFQLCISLPQSLLLHQKLTELKLCSKLPQYSNAFKDSLKFKLAKELSLRLGLSSEIDSPFKISLLFTHLQTEEAYVPFLKERGCTKVTKLRKQSKITYTHDIVNKSVDGLNDKELDKYFPDSLPHLSTLTSVTVQLYHKPVFIGGRYNKYSRTLPQSPWVIDGVKKSESSIQEMLTGETERIFRPDTIKFSSSGREDIDVRMLGTGRPFMLELVNPRLLEYEEEQQELQEAINSSTDEISVRELKMVDKKTSSILKTGEEEKEKLYSSLIWTSQSITPQDLVFLNEVSNLTISQKTPIRVLHRRSLATRQRLIYSLKAKWIDSHHFQLDLSTQAGTYIKEFVHGDLGRTTPNLCGMMEGRVDIIALDVMEIKLKWPL